VKNKWIVSLIVLAILAPSCGGGSGGGGTPRPPVLVKWQTQQRSPTSSDLRAVIFANPTQGLIAGKNGTIFRTDDGGQTWTQQEFIPSNRTGDINAMSAFGTTLAAAGTDATAGGRIWEGRNSTSWVTVDATNSGPLAYTDVNVSDPGLGNVPGSWWAIRNNGFIDYSFNGTPGLMNARYSPPVPPVVAWPNPGWDLVPTHPVDWTETNAVLFVGVTGFGLVGGIDNGWSPNFAGNPGDPGTSADDIPPITNHGPQGQIARTDNYGVTWVRQSMLPSTDIPKRIRRVILTRTATNLARAYACGEDTGNKGVVFASSPAVSDQWDHLLGTNVPSNAPIFRALSFPIDDETGWVVGDTGTIYKITAVVTTTGSPPVRNYAYTWSAQSSTVTDNLYAVSFADENTGYAVGDNGVVVKTVNGGTTWTKISKGDAVNFNAAAFTDDGTKGIAVGDGGVVYRTLDGGTTWTLNATIAGTPNPNLLGVSIPRAGALTTAYLCGQGGTLRQNTDVWGAGSWNTVTGSDPADTYEAILFPQGPDKGVCVGSTVTGRKLLRTNDGVTWSGAPLPATPAGSYKALSCNPSGTEIYAAGGTNGAVSLSQDLANGWLTWVDSPSPPGGSLTLSSVAAPIGNAFTAFAGASNGNLYRLAMGSGLWTSAGAPFGSNPARLAYQDDQVLVCVTSAGLIFTTSNGGGSWTQSYAHTKDVPRNVWMSPTNTGLGYVVCSNGTILKTVTGGQ